MKAAKITSILLTLTLLSLGCGGEVTEVLVVTDSDLPVPGGLDRLVTVVTSPAGAVQQSQANLNDQGFPRQLSLIHETGALGPFEVTVTGSIGGADLVSRSARFTFVQNESRVLVMHLVGACVSTSCAGDQTCTEDGCRPLDVAEGQMPVWNGTPPTLGGGGVDAGTDSGPVCVAESCNGADDDCDDAVDEDFDLMTDPDNCGMCGQRCRGRNDTCCAGTCERRCP